MKSFAPPMPAYRDCTRGPACQEVSLVIRDFFIQDDSIFVSADSIVGNSFLGDLYLLDSLGLAWRNLELDRSGFVLETSDLTIEHVTKIQGRYFVSNRLPDGGGYASVQTCEMASHRCSDFHRFPYGPHTPIFDLGYSQGTYFAVFYPGFDGASFWSMTAKDVWVRDSTTGHFDARFVDAENLYLSVGNTVYRRDKDSLSEIFRMPMAVRQFGISGKTLLGLSETMACVADLESGTARTYPVSFPGMLSGTRSAVQVVGKYMVYGNGSDLIAYDPQKRLLKTFRLSRWISDNRWIYKDGQFISAGLYGLVSLAESEIDRHF
jgi:hypothetical protein